MRSLFLVLAIFTLLPLATADDYDRLKVGVQPDGRVVVPMNQILQPERGTDGG